MKTVTSRLSIPQLLVPVSATRARIDLEVLYTVCIASQLILIKLSVSDTGVNGGSHYSTDILADNTSSLESAKTKESLSELILTPRLLDVSCRSIQY